VEIVVAEDLAHTSLDKVPEIGVRRQEVAGTANGFNHFVQFSVISGL
jgi:hypothetical protein